MMVVFCFVIRLSHQLQVAIAARGALLRLSTLSAQCVVCFLRFKSVVNVVNKFAAAIGRIRQISPCHWADYIFRLQEWVNCPIINSTFLRNKYKIRGEVGKPVRTFFAGNINRLYAVGDASAVTKREFVN
jgi:hypothetical protein